MGSGSKVLVSIIMGSDSDLEVMKGAAEILDEFGIGYEITVASAHRTPERVFRYVSEAEKKGVEVIIAGAGGAAHLPGFIAAITNLPVIGVPINSSSIGGLDSLLSIAQMPSGVPVATVAINNSKNAGILASQILAIKYPDIKAKLQDYRMKLKKSVEERAKQLEELGYKIYLEKMKVGKDKG